MAINEEKDVTSTILLFIGITSTIVLGVFIFLYSYQDKVYWSDRDNYNAEKSQWDSIQTIYVKKAEDSVFNYWIAHNDTSIRKIKKITKKLTYASSGYYKKTDKLECERPSRHSDKYVCEPIEERVITGYYVSGHYYDTTWTNGYKNRDEWIKKARNIAHTEALKHKVEFRPYDGHKYQYIIKSGSWLMIFILVYSLPGVVIGLVSLLSVFLRWLTSLFGVLLEKVKNLWF